MRARALARWSAAVAVCAVAPLAITPAAATARPRSSEPTLVQGPFYGTPGTYQYQVPAGVDQIVAEVGGAFGGNSGSFGSTTVGGAGDVIQGTLAVTPGQVLTLVVGAHGNAGCASSCGSAGATVGAGGAGYGKGGSGNDDGTTIGGGGGGASSVAIGSAAPSLVGAGGGGAGASGPGQPNDGAATGSNDGGDGDGQPGALSNGSGGGGGGLPGGSGGSNGGGGLAGKSLGMFKGSSTVNDGYIQLAFYEPGLDAEDDAYAVKQNTTLAVPAPGVLANDRAFGLPPKLARPALHGAVSLATDGSFTYKPAFGFLGYDTFTYALQDSDRQAIATVTILVGKVAAGALTSIGVPGKGRVLLGLACGLTGKCPFDIAILKKVGGVNRRIAHGTTTYLPKHSGVFSFRLPQSTRVTFGTGSRHVVHATLYITLHRKGRPIIVIANRSITIT